MRDSQGFSHSVLPLYAGRKCWQRPPQLPDGSGAHFQTQPSPPSITSPAKQLQSARGKHPAGINTGSRAWEQSPGAQDEPASSGAGPGSTHCTFTALPFIIRYLNNQSSPSKKHLNKFEREERRKRADLCWQVLGPEAKEVLGMLWGSLWVLGWRQSSLSALRGSAEENLSGML